MTPGLTSIVVPTYQHAVFLPGALDTALDQTAPVEVIVIDDGSTDNTAAVLKRYASDARVRVLRQDHEGPSAARNAGIDAASGEFVMFLDADDTIAPDKVARQIHALSHRVGWVLCDVRIEDVNGQIELASQRYDYAGKGIGGWLQPLLGVANFIPIHSPIVRRSVLKGIRFDTDRTPEDWHFWYAVAGLARAAYVPAVLATYRKRRGGRNTGRWRGLQAHPGATLPLRLNLGCGTRGKPSWNPLPGFVNLDKSLGWCYEDGLRQFADASVAGITISHSLMFVQIADWPAVFAEFARVLRPGGVLRITEDDIAHPESKVYGVGWKGSESAVTLTSAAMVRAHMEAAGLAVYDVDGQDTRYADGSLRQRFHGEPPDVFFIEGVRADAVLFSPHADDETLFAAFTIIRHRPRVVICFPSARDYGDTAVRLEESRAAVGLLGGGPVEQWEGGKIEKRMREFNASARPARVWAPSANASHPEHVAVAQAAAAVFGDRLTRFQTYDVDHGGKVRAGDPVPFEPGWPGIKRAALACYRTQIEHPRAAAFFTDDLAEYVE